MHDPEIGAMFAPEPGLTYLDAATYGLPPAPTVAAMQRALDQWTHGTGRWVEDWDRPSDAARGHFAELIGATAADIALLPSVSVGTGLVASTLTPHDVVLVPDDEHTSDLFPLLVAERRGVTVRQVPFAALADAIDDATTWVVTSVVQMQTGRVADIATIGARARALGAHLLVDTTHATPFIDIDVERDGIDVLVCHAYKHLLGARGCAFLFVRPALLDTFEPAHANWRGADDPWTTFYGGPLRLAADASRFDVSLAWLPWVATTESVRLAAGWRRTGALDRPLALAASMARALRLEPTGSSLVCVPVADPERCRAALTEARIKAAVRGPNIRFSLHLWNDEADVERAVAAIAPSLA